MDGFRVFMNCVCMCIFAAGPMRLSDFAMLGNNMGGGISVVPLVHGDPVPAVIASAPLPHSDIPNSRESCLEILNCEIADSHSCAVAPSAAHALPLWSWQATLAPEANHDDWKLGAAVSIYERTIAVGPARDWDIGVDQGGVQLYTCIGEKWLQSSGIFHPNGDMHAQFGACVALRNHMLLVGAPRDSAMAFQSGAAFLYEQVDDEWQLNATLVRSTANDADQFGASVALDENTLVKVAESTGGRYFRARNADELNNIYMLLDKLEPVEKDKQYFRPRSELYYWPLALALGLAGFIGLSRVRLS